MSQHLFQIAPAGSDVVILTLTLPDILDPLELDKLNESILATIADTKSTRWAIDLSRSSYMGSSVLGLMVNLRQRIKQAGGSLVLFSMTPQLTSVFHACSLQRLFTIVKNQDEAMQLLNGK